MVYRVITRVGNISGVAGILVCLVSGLARLAGNYYIFGYEGETIFVTGIALMVLACLVKLHQLTGSS